MKPHFQFIWKPNWNSSTRSLQWNPVCCFDMAAPIHLCGKGKFCFQGLYYRFVFSPSNYRQIHSSSVALGTSYRVRTYSSVQVGPVLLFSFSDFPAVIYENVYSTLARVGEKNRASIHILAGEISRVPISTVDKRKSYWFLGAAKIQRP